MQPGSTTIDDFPSLYIEVWDFNRVAKGSFLGCCFIPPAVYFSRNKPNTFDLIPSPKLKPKENKLATGGTLSISLRLEDSKSTIGNQRFIFSGPLRTLPIAIYVEVQILRARDLMICNRVGRCFLVSLNEAHHHRHYQKHSIMA